ncbi:MAG: TIM barrel protein, partial [Planctomycetota bacterium]|nr:TIM barrel protein [Planctomycetota bacterium]
SKDEKLVLAAAQRMTNVVDAAHILGCSAASLKVEAVDDDDTLARVAKALKPIMERAEKVDINLVLAPHKGLTTKPERVTELLKKVGGFRIGTYPDFETAFEASGKKSEGAVSYLHRLTPYASAVCASTTGFGISPGKGKNATEVINPENMGDPKTASHVAYELRPLLEAVLSVGYDGPLALDYRGPGDVAAGLALSRSTILAALGADEDDEDDLDDLMDELEAEDAPDAEESEP